MVGVKRKNYPSRKKNKAQRERAIEYHSKENKSSSTGRKKTSDHGEKKNSRSKTRKSFDQGHKNRNLKSRNRSGGSRFKKSDLEPSMMVNTTIKIKDDKKCFQPRAFYQLDISPKLQSRIKKTTEIQDKTFEIVSQGESIIGIANTGTGKTGAFLIPIINRLINNKNKNKTIVLIPTRELAQQVDQEFKSLTKGLKIFSSCFIGGTNVNKDINKRVN